MFYYIEFKQVNKIKKSHYINFKGKKNKNFLFSVWEKKFVLFLQEIIIDILNISKTKISISKFNISVDGNYNLGKIDKKDKILFTNIFYLCFFT